MGNRNLVKFVIFYFFSLLYMITEMENKFLILICFFSMYIVFVLFYKPFLKQAIFIFVAIILGFIVSISWTFYYDCVDQEITDDSLFIGYIYKKSPQDKSYTFRATHITNGRTTKRFTGKYIVYIYGEEIEGLYKKVMFKGRLNKGKKRRNPMDFDQALYNRGQGYRGILEVNSYDINDMGTDFKVVIFTGIHKLRKRIYNNLDNVFRDKEFALIIGLTLGDKGYIDEDIMEDFRTSGTAHILAVSGLHMGILFMSISALLNLIKLSSSKKAIITLFLLWFFVFFTGQSPSILRACIMISMALIAPFLNRRYDSLTSLCVVVLLSTLLNPYVIYNISFQLSISAVLSIILFYGPMSNCKIFGYIPTRFKSLILISLIAQLGTIPILAYTFNEVSLLGMIFNIPTILIITALLPLLLLIILASILSPILVIPLGVLAVPTLKLLVAINGLSRELPLGHILVTSPYRLNVIAYYIILIYMIKPMGLDFGRVRKQYFIAIMILCIVSCGNWVYANRNLRYTFFDVGQGDAGLIQSPFNKTNILIDGGRDSSDKYMKLLMKNRVDRIDLMILSHSDADHINGLIEVAKSIDIGVLMVGETRFDNDKQTQLLDICNSRGIKIIKVNKGDEFLFKDEVFIKILHPDRKYSDYCNDENNNSVVALIECRGIRSLYTGDIEEIAEELISKGESCVIDILKVSHHGSSTSTSEQFLSVYKPSYAVIQVGKNKFGHPDSRVLERFKRNGVNYYRNDSDGAIIIGYNNKEIYINKMVK